MDEIKRKIVEALQESYDTESICVYHLEFKNVEQTQWRAEVEAYVDVEDGPYFFIFERNDSKLRYWINDARSQYPNQTFPLVVENFEKEKGS